MIWNDLSDGEIVARLTNRGVPLDVARLVVLRRSWPQAEEFIAAYLGKS